MCCHNKRKRRVSDTFKNTQNFTVRNFCQFSLSLPYDVLMSLKSITWNNKAAARDGIFCCCRLKLNQQQSGFHLSVAKLNQSNFCGQSREM